MEYFQKLGNFIKLNDLLGKKYKQLHFEDCKDRELEDSYKECPNLVFNFLIKERFIRREIAKNIYEKSIVEYPEQIMRHLDFVEKIYMNNREFNCSNLQSITENMQKYYNI